MPRAERGPGEFFLLWHLRESKRPVQEQQKELTIMQHLLLALAEMLEKHNLTIYLQDPTTGKEYHWKAVIKMWTVVPGAEAKPSDATD
jgi:hypothetical protein